MDDEKKTCCCGCSQRKKERSPEEYKRLIHRLNRIEGQIRGIRGMVENDAYCPDILVQSAAAGAALNAFNKELLASHIRTCVVEDIRDGKDEVIDELVAMEVAATKRYCEVLRSLGSAVPQIDPRLEHMLVTGMMNAYCEVILHDMPLADAQRYVEELGDFYTAGWLKIMGQ